MHDGHNESEPVPVRVNQVGRAVMDAAFRVHSAPGPGLLESAYEACLAEDLRQGGFRVERQVGIPLSYGEVRLDVGYRLDVLVENCVLVEIKSVDALAPIHKAQVLTYLRFSGVRLGYLINFNSALLKTALRRLAL